MYNSKKYYVYHIGTQFQMSATSIFGELFSAFG